MLIRRIVMSVCAVCLASPAAALASPAKGPYGVAPAGPRLTGQVKGPYGVTPVPGQDIIAKAKGPYGVTAAGGPTLTAKAKGPYGLAPVTGAPARGGGTSQAAAGARSASPTAWRVVAICEAALLAAFALAGAALVAGRRRAPHMAT